MIGLACLSIYQAGYSGLSSKESGAWLDRLGCHWMISVCRTAQLVSYYSLTIRNTVPMNNWILILPRILYHASSSSFTFKVVHQYSIRQRQHLLYCTKAVSDGFQMSKDIWLYNRFVYLHWSYALRGAATYGLRNISVRQCELIKVSIIRLTIWFFNNQFINLIHYFIHWLFSSTQTYEINSVHFFFNSYFSFSFFRLFRDLSLWCCLFVWPQMNTLNARRLDRVARTWEVSM